MPSRRSLPAARAKSKSRHGGVGEAHSSTDLVSIYQSINLVLSDAESDVDPNEVVTKPLGHEPITSPCHEPVTSLSRSLLSRAFVTSLSRARVTSLSRAFVASLSKGRGL